MDAHATFCPRAEMVADMAPFLPRVSVPSVLVMKFFTATTRRSAKTCPANAVPGLLSEEYVALTTDNSATTCFGLAGMALGVAGTVLDSRG